MPFTLAAAAHSELTIRKSRFIGCVEPVSGRAQATQRVTALRALYPGATHVCWALMAGGHSAANDDGEPGGTAGRPMLEVLRHQDLDGVLATVVRYYGGTPLGAGGLVRAYTDCVAQALLKADRLPLIRWDTLRCELPYALEGWLRRELDGHGARLLAIEHGDRVNAHLELPASQVDAFVARLTDASQGQAHWQRDNADNERA
ncbi:YigZ family protein [Hydrogenophaga sp.]|uniref:IMPACT family protein n=1 Tax=Hydrogenophaga sp. TaxID=1904254 RepID=UPI002629303A|nr:YigZ family protein [Hydrogenophaga sp.]MCW5655084.1 YigZ family protein [Hydrogenophaga sp.]